MRQLLHPHPQSRCLAAERIEVGVARPRPNSLVLSYIVIGKISELHFAPLMPPARSDDLWRHTCFEAFVCASSAAAYYEFNFAPSTQWAAYRFTGYRSGQRAAEISRPSIEARSSPGQYTLQASLDLGGLADLPPGERWHLGLSTVIEDTRGSKSYWALAHPPGKPDFHHAGSFAHELAAPVRS
jgi:hypothetical protein